MILNQVVEEVKRRVPQINEPLILNLRQDMLSSIEKIIDNFMRVIVSDQIEEIQYLDYEEVSPIKLAEYFCSDNNYTTVDIKDNNLKLMEYKFSIREGEKIDHFSLFYFLPFLHEEALTLKGNNYYPIFNIIDRFLIRFKNRGNDDKVGNYQYEGISISTMLFNLKFYKRGRDKQIYQTVKGTIVAATIIKFNAHHNLKSDSKYPPALIYPFAKYGYFHTLETYGCSNDIELVTGVNSEDEDHEYFKIDDFLYVKVTNESLKFLDKRRFIITLVYLLHFSPTSIENIINDDKIYFQLNLGKWIQGANAPISQQKNQAIEHLKTIDRCISIKEQADLALEGIIIEDTYQLIYYMFHHIDKLIFYQTNNLFNKRISLLSQLLFNFISKLNRQVFNKDKIINNEIKKKDIGSIFTKNEKLLVDGIEQMSEVFITESSLSNGNWLLSVGARKFKSKKIKNISKRQQGKSGRGSANKNDSYIYAHPSQLFVESILNLPSSNPCYGGTINIFYKDVDLKTGILNEPDNYKEFEEIFKDME